MSAMSPMMWSLPPSRAIRSGAARVPTSGGLTESSLAFARRRRSEEEARSAKWGVRVGLPARAHRFASGWPSPNLTAPCAASPCTALPCAADRSTDDRDRTAHTVAAIDRLDPSTISATLSLPCLRVIADRRLTVTADPVSNPRLLILEIARSTVAPPRCGPVSVAASGGW